MGTLLASVTRPYWSTVTWETFAPEPYMPALTPLVGRVVKGTVPVKFDELMFEIPDPFEATSNPCMFRPVKVPTEVMFGWAAWTTELAVATVPMMAFEWIPKRPWPSPEIVPAMRDPMTLKVVRVPREVMLDWAGLTTEPATFAKFTVPERFETCKLLKALPPPMKKGADTFPEA